MSLMKWIIFSLQDRNLSNKQTIQTNYLLALLLDTPDGELSPGVDLVSVIVSGVVQVVTNTEEEKNYVRK